MLKHLIISLIGVSALTGGLAFWLVQIPQLEPTSAHADDPWHLPTLSNSDHLQKIYFKLRGKLKPWKEKKTKSKASPKPKAPTTPTTSTSKKAQWQLVGIVQEGRQRFALLLNKSTNKVNRYAVGSALPEGTQLLTIRDDFVEISQAGKTKTVHLYR
ncbi:MAG TPA: hypothetical protein EYP59_22395 [Thiotrichaceae bacterium]|nr:hypothetical protein [Thiotrichaceae bacterium]